MKQTHCYLQCMEEITSYLSDVYRRKLPHIDFKEPIEKQFELEWQNGSLFGWEKVIACGENTETKIETECEEKELYCSACFKF